MQRPGHCCAWTFASPFLPWATDLDGWASVDSIHLYLLRSSRQIALLLNTWIISRRAKSISKRNTRRRRGRTERYVNIQMYYEKTKQTSRDRSAISIYHCVWLIRDERYRLVVFSTFASSTISVRCYVRMDYHVYSPIHRWSLSVLVLYSNSTVDEDTSCPDQCADSANNWQELVRIHCAIDCSWFRRPAAMHRLRCSRVRLRERRYLDAIVDVCRTRARTRTDDNRERTGWTRRQTSWWFEFHVSMNVKWRPRWCWLGRWRVRHGKREGKYRRSRRWWWHWAKEWEHWCWWRFAACCVWNNAVLAESRRWNWWQTKVCNRRPVIFEW